MLASDGRTKIGVVSNGELDGDNSAPVMVKAVQARAERAVSAVAVIVRRGSAITTILVTAISFVVVGRGEYPQRAPKEPKTKIALRAK